MTPADNLIDSSPPSRIILFSGEKKALAALVIAAFVARLVLSGISLGSNDYQIWTNFGFDALKSGLIQPYSDYQGDLNHPPIPLAWAAGARWLSNHTGLTFSFVFRLAPIAADAVCCVLLFKIWSRRTGSCSWGWVGAAVYAWSLGAIFDGAYHCNTDNICAMFTLLSAYLVASGSRYVWAGAALGAAINVKIVPVLIVPVFFATCPDGRSFLRFLLGLSVGAIPFVIMTILSPVFLSNLLGYKSYIQDWGIMIFLNYGHYPSHMAPRVKILQDWYYDLGRYFMLLVSAVVAFLVWRLRRWDAFEAGALAWCVFLMLTPGWGMQYVIYALPLLAAVSLRYALSYGFLAGLYLVAFYWVKWTGKLPLESVFFTYDPHIFFPLPIGVLAWGVLGSFFVSTLGRGVFVAIADWIRRGGSPSGKLQS